MTQPKLIPTEKQLRFLDWEFGVFFHFGIRSFFLNHDDWDGKEMPASAFNPDRLDCCNAVFEDVEPDLICTAENPAFARVRMGGTGCGVIKGLDIQR